MILLFRFFLLWPTGLWWAVNFWLFIITIFNGLSAELQKNKIPNLVSIWDPARQVKQRFS